MDCFLINFLCEILKPQMFFLINIWVDLGQLMWLRTHPFNRVNLQARFDNMMLPPLDFV